jgi:hypothetical protein
MTLGLLGVAGCGESRDRRPATETRSPGRETAAVYLPYLPPGQQRLGQPRGVIVTNRTSTSKLVTVVVRHGDRDLFVDTLDLPPGQRLAFPGLLIGAGTYQVVAETAAGARTTYEWTVTGEMGHLAIVVDAEVAVRPQVVCDPECAPFATAVDGRAGYPGTVDARTKHVYLVNPEPRRRTADVAVSTAAGVVLEGTYEVPSGTQVVLPLSEETFDYRVVVTTDGETGRYRWRSPPGGSLYVTLGEAVSFTCGTTRRDLRVVNDDNRAHTVSVVVTDDGVAAVDRRIALEPGETRVDAGVVPAGGNRTVVVETERDGRTVTAWDVCPPPGAVWVVVTERGVQVSVSPTGSD